MSRYDRDELIRRIDLRALADRLLGPHAGSERHPMWTCPIETHAQTGRTPPLSMYVSRTGEERWRCHGCGAGGSAIDLVMHTNGLNVRQAMDYLAGQARIEPEIEATGERRQPDPPAREPHPGVEPYVQACAEQLWTKACTEPAKYLIQKRGLSEEILRLNRVGFDPGPVHLDRPHGVPRYTGVVLPVLDDNGRATYTQTRRLGDITGPRYINCGNVVAPNPRVAFYRTRGDPTGPLVVCEGAIDALTVADAGYQAAGYLGSALADPASAAVVMERSANLVVAFDADHAGDRGAKELMRLVEDAGNVSVRLRPPGDVVDLNEWSLRADVSWSKALQEAVARTGPVRTPKLGMALT